MEKKNQEQLDKAVKRNAAEIEGIVKEASPQDQKISKQQQIMLQKRAAQELADYKRRLRESVELKRLQVEEIELNIRYYEGRKRIKEVDEEMMRMEAEEAALAQKFEEQNKKELDKKLPKLVIAKGGKPRTEEEIKEGKDELKAELKTE